MSKRTREGRNNRLRRGVEAKWIQKMGNRNFPHNAASTSADICHQGLCWVLAGDVASHTTQRNFSHFSDYEIGNFGWNRTAVSHA